MTNLVIYNKNNDFNALMQEFNNKAKESNLMSEIRKTVKKIKR